MALIEGALNDYRNLAIIAWMQSYPVPEKLERYLDTINPDFRDEARAAATSVEQAALAFLKGWNRKIGLHGFEAFAAALREHLRAQHPWLSPAASAKVSEFLRWVVWNAGY